MSSSRRTRRKRGLVKWFDQYKGYGFLITKDVQDDIFVHHTEIKMEGYRTLKTGQEVDFYLMEGAKGLYSESVSLVDPRGER